MAEEIDIGCARPGSPNKIVQVTQNQFSECRYENKD